MGFLQNARQRLGSAANFVARHGATAAKVALGAAGAAAAAGAAYRAYHSDAANAIRFQNESRRYIDEHGARLMEEYRRDRALGVAGAVSDDDADDYEEHSPRHH